MVVVASVMVETGRVWHNLPLAGTTSPANFDPSRVALASPSRRYFMLVRTHARLIPVVVMTSLVGCMGGQGPEQRIVKNGEDLIALGSANVSPTDSVGGDVIFAGGE